MTGAEGLYSTYRQLPYGDIAIQPTPTSTTMSGTGGHHVESVVLAAACGIIASGLFILVSNISLLMLIFY